MTKPTIVVQKPCKLYVIVATMTDVHEYRYSYQEKRIISGKVNNIR